MRKPPLSGHDMAGATEFDCERFDPALEAESTSDLHRVAGEDVPAWLPTLLACLGMAFALAAASPNGLPQLRRPAAPRAIVIDQEPARPTMAEPAPPSSSTIAEPPAAPVAEPAPQAETDPSATERAALSSAQPAPIETQCFPAIGIAFGRGSARPILSGTEKSLETLLLWMTQRKDAVLSVEGRADSTGSERQNLLLSFRRAKAVVKWLAGAGVPEGRMIARAAGANEAKGASLNAAADRRAILRMEGVETCRDASDIEKQ